MSFTASIQESLDSLALRFKTLSNDETITFEQLSTIDKELGDLLERYQQFKNIQTFLDDEELQDLKNDIQTLKSDLQNKLDTNYYKGETGTSISNVSTSNNELIVSLDDGQNFNLGNFTNDFNNLTNKPIIQDLEDYEEGTFLPLVYGDTIEGTCIYDYQSGTYVKVGNLVTVSLIIVARNFTGSGALILKGLPFVFKNIGVNRPSVAVYTSFLDYPDGGIPLLVGSNGVSNMSFKYSRPNSAIATINVSEIVDVRITFSYQTN